MTQRKSAVGKSVVEWPHTVVSADDSDVDLGPPLAQLLVDLDIRGSDDDRTTAGSASAAFTGTPVSVAIIEAGATAASKGWAVAIGGLGGATAVWSWINGFWSDAGAARGAIAVAVAVVVAACALGAALIMYGDVRARGEGAAAQYHARAEVATAFLRGASDLGSGPRPPVDLAAANGKPTDPGGAARASGDSNSEATLAGLAKLVAHELEAQAAARKKGIKTTVTGPARSGG
jgi:hypothetical protein